MVLPNLSMLLKRVLSSRPMTYGTTADDDADDDNEALPAIYS